MVVPSKNRGVGSDLTVTTFTVDYVSLMLSGKFYSFFQKCNHARLKLIL